MRSLSTLKARVDQLLAERAKVDAESLTVAVLPDNGRGPVSDAPWPRINRTGNAVVVSYLPEDGAPTADGIAQLIGAQP